MLLTAENIKKNYGMRQLLDGVTLYLNEGDRIGLIGVNGTGKSTFLKVLAGIEEADSGRVTRDPNVQVSYLPQVPAMNDELTVLEQVYDYMGQFLASVCCVADPEIVVLGGGVSKAGQPLLDGAKRYFDKYVFHASASIRFALASLGNDAGAYGAFKLVLDAQTK
jgi:ABC-type hemin transport system ATPase subunit